MNCIALIKTFIETEGNWDTLPTPKKANVPLISEKNTWTSACAKKK